MDQPPPEPQRDERYPGAFPEDDGPSGTVWECAERCLG